MADQQPFVPSPKDLELVRKFLKETLTDSKNLEDTMKIISKDAGLFGKNLESAKDYFGDLGDAASRLSASLRESINDMSKGNYFTKSMIGGFRNLESIATKFKNDMLDYSTMSKAEIIRNISKIQQTNELLNSLVKQGHVQGEQAEEVKRTIADGEMLLAQAKKRLDKEKEINKNLGIGGQAFKALSKQLQNIGVDSEIIDDMNLKLRSLAANNKVSLKDFAVVVKKGLTEAFQDPLVRFTLGLKLFKSGINDIKKAFDIFLEFDKIFTDTARNIGMSTDQVRKMSKEAGFVKNTIEGTNGAILTNVYTQQQLNKAISDVNTQLGLSVDIGASAVDEFTAMTNQMGLSAEEATNIYKLGLLNNKSLQDTNKSISAGIVAAQKSTGVQINAKQVFQEIGKLSAGILVKFRQNPEALAKAVAQAKALGTNLEQVDKVGESILNFESSIENELKAELITGKQLNLEKARYAALTGDQVTLTRELADQVGSLEDFQNMNVLQQKSLAEAFGMTKDEVASMLQQQETYNKLGDVSGKSAEEQLKLAKERGLTEEDSLVVNLKQQAASEKMAAAFDNFKAAISNILTGIQPLLDIFAEMSKSATLVYTVLGAMAAISFAKTIGGLVLMTNQLLAIGAAKGTGAVADAASAGSLAAQATTAAVIAGEEGIIAGEKTAGAAADVASATAKTAQAAAAGTQAATEAIITTEKVAQATASSIINPVTAVIGLALAGIIAAAIYSSAKKKPKMAAGGIVMPTSGGTDVTVGEAGKPEAIIPLNSSKAPGMLGGNIDLSPMIAAINEVKNAVNTLASKPAPQFSLNVDGKAIGTVVGKQIETGTAQSQYTSYKVA